MRRRLKRLAALLTAVGLLCCILTAASWADETPPTLSAYVSGATLYISASDSVSGVAAVRINGLNLPRAGEDMEVSLAGYTTTKTLTVQAVDNAGNYSDSVTLNNPCYGMELSFQEPEPETTATAAAENELTEQNTAKTTTSASTATPAKTETAVSASPKPVQTQTKSADSDALTPAGNLSLVDDYVEDETENGAGDETEGETATEDTDAEETSEIQRKQFLTVTTRNGNYFYIIVDRDGETENVYFLNQVDESDLLSLLEEDGQTERESEQAEEATPAESEETPVCVCNRQCEAGRVNAACVVCTMDLDDCTGEPDEETSTEETEVSPDTAENETEAESEPEEEESGGSAAPVAICVLLVLLCAGGAAVYLKFFRKQAVNGLPNRDDWVDDEEEEAARPTETISPEAWSEGDGT